MRQKKSPELKINSMIVSCNLNIKKFLPLEIEKLVKNGDLNWIVVNEDISPVIQARIEKPGKNSHGQDKCLCINLRTSGKMTIFGTTTKKEAKKAVEKVVVDLMHIGKFN